MEYGRTGHSTLGIRGHAEFPLGIQQVALHLQIDGIHAGARRVAVEDQGQGWILVRHWPEPLQQVSGHGHPMEARIQRDEAHIQDGTARWGPELALSVTECRTINGQLDRVVAHEKVARPRGRLQPRNPIPS